MTPSDSESLERDAAWPIGDALDRALAAGLRAPALPAGFQASLRQAIASEADAELRERRRLLDAEHARRLAEMQAGYVRLRRDTLAIALVGAFAGGLLAALALPWMATMIDIDAAALAPLVAVVVGLGVAARVWFERFGFPHWR